MNKFANYVAAIVLPLVTVSFSSNSANADDIDCEIILCMAGGFAPAECKDAYKQMIDNITPWPIKPPFGICSFVGANGGETQTAMSSPEFDYTRNVRVLWYSETISNGISADGSLNDKPRYTLQSCEMGKQKCTTLAQLSSEGLTGQWVSEHGLSIPVIGGSPTRAVGIEYSDHDGNYVISGWNFY